MYEVQHWLQQVKHVMVLTIIFLGTALPALFYGALLGYGIILDNASSPLHILMIVWSLLFIHSLILLMCKNAILGSRYKYFLETIQSISFRRITVDIWLGLICSPFLIMLGVILAAVEFEHWHKFTHGFTLFVLQLVLTFVCLYRASALVWFLALSLLSNLWLKSFELQSALTIYTFLLLLAFYLSSVITENFVPSIIAIPAKYKLWLSITLSGSSKLSSAANNHNKTNSLLMCSAFCAILLMMGSYAASNLPDYQQAVHFMTAQLLMLACLSLQISIDKAIKHYALFFAQFMPDNKLYIAQYWVCISTAFVMLFIASLVFNSAVAFVHLFTLGFCLLFLKRYSSFLIVGWLSTSVILGFFLF